MTPSRHPDRARLLARHPEEAKALQRIPNVGTATAGDLLLLGLRTADDVARQDPDEMYERVCRIDGRRHPESLRDLYRAAVDAARGRPRPWFEYSRERKLRARAQARAVKARAGK